uniref:Heme chaperone HemW n=1 Tax=Candidatus Kentrum eta TaxID=2126337 RepID=A0A450UP94_9GAMM|nr:MAG: oxygen-independent coproporphyrinogen-3 oxidase [Candidatus Kentron sp. H]VFJ94363.1 MAG: oxygen-independent coproporphyrinogen-3 oxidase [Candidatus Kentron sp. H]VFK01165.1 MAG: oxygen-independent coproporphyrinogen-3 oxidase [Candidatus Kentron sp. H]
MVCEPFCRTVKYPCAGIYLHIPFCRQLCYYCDFHFSLSLRDKDEMMAAMAREMALRRDYLNGRTADIETLYFGGGTPSVLELADIERLLDRIAALFPLSANAEITLEANPDDLAPEYLLGLKALGINRLSIGVQSFHDQELAMMNRRHTAGQAVRCVEDAFRCGFDNVTLDLIYGLPDSTPDSWSHSLEMALALSPPHLACYHLAFEERTAFANFRKKGQLGERPEAVSWAQYQWLCDRMGAGGYEHYEISNFAQAGWQSRHNKAYWAGGVYLGIGPSAHSFDGTSRQWNIAHNRKYREAVSREAGFHESTGDSQPLQSSFVFGDDAARHDRLYEREVLSDKDRFHDYLLTRLRTAEGIDPRYLQNHFTDLYPDFYKRFVRYLGTDALAGTGHRYRLTEKGMFQSDGIIGDLFVE